VTPNQPAHEATVATQGRIGTSVRITSVLNSNSPVTVSPLIRALSERTSNKLAASTRIESPFHHQWPSSSVYDNVTFAVPSGAWLSDVTRIARSSCAIAPSVESFGCNTPDQASVRIVRTQMSTGRHDADHDGQSRPIPASSPRDLTPASRHRCMHARAAFAYDFHIARQRSVSAGKVSHAAANRRRERQRAID